MRASAIRWRISHSAFPSASLAYFLVGFASKRNLPSGGGWGYLLRNARFFCAMRNFWARLLIFAQPSASVSYFLVKFAPTRYQPSGREGDFLRHGLGFCEETQFPCVFNHLRLRQHPYPTSVANFLRAESPAWRREIIFAHVEGDGWGGGLFTDT